MMYRNREEEERKEKQKEGQKSREPTGQPLAAALARAQAAAGGRGFAGGRCRGRGRGVGRGMSPRGRAPLGVDHCALCKGHGRWKNECPERTRGKAQPVPVPGLDLFMMGTEDSE